MKLLFLDTSAKVANVFVTEDGRLLAKRSDSGEKTHASMLLPVCDEALKEAGLELKDIDVIGAVNGPGSYTGIRICVAFAKLLAYGASKPLVCVNTLDYLALSAGANEKGAAIAALLDARNTLCFYRFYRNAPGKGLEAVSEVGSDYCADIVKTAGELFGKDIIVFTGDGSAANRGLIEEAFANASFADAEASRGDHIGAWRSVISEIDAHGGLENGEFFRPENAVANYFKEVHVTLKGQGR